MDFRRKPNYVWLYLVHPFSIRDEILTSLGIFGFDMRKIKFKAVFMRLIRTNFPIKLSLDIRIEVEF